MAQTPPTAKVDELRARLKADPKNRVFFPLAEELRKVGQSAEAEQVLRLGLTYHPTYLSGWVSLGRVLRDLQKNAEAVEALTKALQIDQGNVVAARLLGDAYMGLGQKIEAIRKYKLVVALLPGDEELKGMVERLDREINAPSIPLSVAPDDDESAPVPLEAAPPASDVIPQAPPEFESPLDVAPLAFPVSPPVSGATPGSVFGEESGPFNLRAPEATGDAVPMRATHDESPFEEPLQGNDSADAVAIEAPAGFHIDEAPPTTEVTAPWGDESPEPEQSAWDDEPVAEEMADAAPPPPEDLINTLTMADLYARQGLTDQARRIYENILQNEPGNDEVAQRLARLTAAGAPPAEGSPIERKVARLESWLAKIERSEVGRV